MEIPLFGWNHASIPPSAIKKIACIAATLTLGSVPILKGSVPIFQYFIFSLFFIFQGGTVTQGGRYALPWAIS